MRRPAGSAATAQINDPGPSKPGDWITYGGAYNSQRYSTLNQVTAANASRLQVKWVYHLTNSRELEMTPVVQDGVMYIADPDFDNRGENDDRSAADQE